MKLKLLYLVVKLPKALAFRNIWNFASDIILSCSFLWSNAWIISSENYRTVRLVLYYQVFLFYFWMTNIASNELYILAYFFHPYINSYFITLYNVVQFESSRCLYTCVHDWKFHLRILKIASLLCSINIARIPNFLLWQSRVRFFRRGFQWNKRKQKILFSNS